MAMNPRLLRPRASQQAAPCPYPASLLLHFDGNLTDSSANGLTVTANGDAATTTAQSKFGGYSLNPDGGWLTIQDHESLDFGTGDFTVECWVRIDGYGGNNQCPFAKNGDDDWSGGYGWELSASSSFFLCAGATITCDPIPTGQWVHLAVTRSDGFVKAYADGLLIGSGDAAGNLGNAYDLTVGNREITSQGGWVRPFVGYIDDLRITKGLAVYDCAFTPPTAPLSACVTPVPTNRAASLLMHFDGNLTDSSPNGLTVTANGDAATTAAQSKFGGYSLNPDGGHLEVPYDPLFDFGTADFTIEFFIRPDSVSTQQIPLSIGGYPNGAEVYIGGGGLGFACDDGGGWSGFNGSQDATAGEWNHCACVRSAGIVTLYLDGVPVGSSSTYGGALSANSGPVWIGSREGANAVVGYIDDLRVVKGLAVYKGPFTPPTAPLSAIATPQPVNASLVLNFDGNFTDESVNGLTVTANGDAAISTAEKKFGSGSASFDGTGDTLSVSSSPSLDITGGDFTIEFWAFFNNVDSGQQVFSNYTGSGGSLAFYTTSSGQLDYYLAEGSPWDVVAGASVGAISDDQWHHVALVRSGSAFVGYLDGVAGDTTSFSGSIASASSVFLGGSPGGGSFFNGYIDGLRITKAALYCEDFTPPAAPPTPTAVPPCCVASAPPPPSCDPYGTYLYNDCDGCDYGSWYADGNCGQYFDAWAPGVCC